MTDPPTPEEVEASRSVDLYDRVSPIVPPEHQPPPSVRALFGAAAVEHFESPYDRVQVRLYYPGIGASGSALDTGLVPPDPAFCPMPLVVVVPGVNCGPEAYSWLAHRLAAGGFAVATYLFTAPTYRGEVGIVPEIGFRGPTTEGQVLQAVIAAVETITDTERMSGTVDFDLLGVVGHSAGGRAAIYLSELESPKIGAVAIYGAHAARPSPQDRPVFPPVAARCPILLAYGTEDGVVSRSRTRYGASIDEEWDPARKTFELAFPDRDGANLLVAVEGGTHFGFLHPHDEATGRAFLEEVDHAADRHREILAECFEAFFDVHLRNGSLASLEASLNHPDLSIRSR